MAGGRSGGILERSLAHWDVRSRVREVRRAVAGMLDPKALAEQPVGGNVESVMTRSVATCSGTDTLHRAAQLMWDRDCGAIPVVDAEGRAVGLVTDRDLCMAAYTRGRPLSAISVSSFLSGQVYCCSASTSIDEAVARMRAQRIRRLIVVDPRDQKVVGMLAIADLARHLAALGRTRPEALHLLAELLASVSERRASGGAGSPDGASPPSADRAAE